MDWYDAETGRWDECNEDDVRGTPADGGSSGSNSTVAGAVSASESECSGEAGSSAVAAGEAAQGGSKPPLNVMGAIAGTSATPDPTNNGMPAVVHRNPTLGQVNEHYRNGNGQPFIIDESSVPIIVHDRDFRDSNYVTVPVSGAGYFTHGMVTVERGADGKARILPELYNFDQKPGLRHCLRNVGTWIGDKVATNGTGQGTPFLMDYRGTIEIKQGPIFNDENGTSLGW